MQIIVSQRLFFLFASIIVTCIFFINPVVSIAENSQTTVRDHMRIRIKEGKINEAMIAAKELIEYYKTKFQPISIYVYYEKSNGSYILHAFTDYKNLDEYKQITSKARSDPQWQAMLQQSLSAYMEGNFQFNLYMAITTFSQAKPVSNLSQAQEGKLYFSSANLGSFREILAGEGHSKPVTISGTLKMPNEVSGTVPAVIILHGASGVNDYYYKVADMLNNMGIAAFVVDSYEQRGIQSGEETFEKLFHSYSTRISDAYAALELLSTHPKIDKRRIAVMGYSHGAKVALFVASEKIRWSFIADDLRFAAIIAYYPGCFPQFKNIDFTDAPVLMLLAEKDNICPVEACLDYAQRIKDSGADVKAIVYKGAHHQFPVLSGSELINVYSLPDWSNCKQEEYLFLQDDGTWFSPHKNKMVEEVNVYGEFTANCRLDGKAIVAGNNEAKIESIKEYQNLLRRVFNIN
jgi:dienelactone hydrolase